MPDYSTYELNMQEKYLFYSVGFCCLFTVMFLFYHSVLVAVIAGGFVVKLAPFVERQLAQRRQNKLCVQFKDMLYSLSSSLASGRQMEEAIIEADQVLSLMYADSEPIMKEIKNMKSNILENNESDKHLLMDFAMRSHSEDINNFVQVYITCRSMGGNMEKVLSHTADILTDKMNIRREIQALTAQKKLEGRIISLMPLGMLLALNLASPAYIAVLYTTLSGRVIMTLCLVLTGAGFVLMEKLTRIEV